LSCACLGAPRRTRLKRASEDLFRTNDDDFTMKKVNQEGIEGTSPEGTKGVVFRQLLAKNVMAPNFYMRLFDVAPGGNTPSHTHAWEHEVYVVKGKGKIVLGDRDEPLSEGDAVLVTPNELHQFVNDNDSVMRMICVIPKPAED
jgi:quercetin dioxygenase-like cupin family protein